MIVFTFETLLAFIEIRLYSTQKLRRQPPVVHEYQNFTRNRELGRDFKERISGFHNVVQIFKHIGNLIGYYSATYFLYYTFSLTCGCRNEHKAINENNRYSLYHNGSSSRNCSPVNDISFWAPLRTRIVFSMR